MFTLLLLLLDQIVVQMSQSRGDGRTISFDDLRVILNISQLLRGRGVRVTSREVTNFESESELIDQLNPRLRLFEKNIRLTRQLFTNLIDSFLILVTFRYSERSEMIDARVERKGATH